MIKDLLSIKMHNYVTHKDSFIDLSKKGSYFIYSNNLDNKSMDGNGSGKSLILDSFFFALWGKPIRNSSPDNIVGLFDKYCSVEVVLELDDGNYYKITRYRKHPKYKNRPFIFSSKDLKVWTENLGKETASDTDSFISRLLSINYDSAISSIVITKPRHDLNFCESKDTKRKEILSNLLNLQWINEAYLRSKEDNRKFKNILVELNIKIRDIENKINNAVKSLNLYKKERDSFDDSKNTNILSLRTELKELKSGIDRDSINDRISFLDRKISHNDKLINSYYIKLSKFDSVSDLKEKKSALISKKDLIEFKISSEIDNMSNLKKIKKDDVCEFCGSKIKQDHKFHNDNREKVLKIEKNIKSLLADKKVLEKKIKSLNKSINDIDSSSINKISASIKKLDKNNSSLKDERSDLKSSLKFFVSELSRIKKSIIKIKNEKNIWVSKVDESVNSLKRYNNSKNIIEEKILKFNGLLKDSEYAIMAFGNSGIKNDIISGKIALLETTINDFLKKLAGGDIYVTLDNKIQHGQSERIGLMIKDGKKVKPLDYVEWSGGEKTRIRIATELSINYIQDNFLNFLFIDEGFDDLDNMGLKIMLDVFKSQKMKKIICISNRPDTIDIFKNKIHVVMENGTSRVEQR